MNGDGFKTTSFTTAAATENAGPENAHSVGCSRSHVHNGASHVHRVRVRARVRVSVRVSFCGHYVDIVAANCGRLRLQPTVTRKMTHRTAALQKATGPAEKPSGHDRLSPGPVLFFFQSFVFQSCSFRRSVTARGNFNRSSAPLRLSSVARRGLTQNAVRAFLAAM